MGLISRLLREDTTITLLLIFLAFLYLVFSPELATAYLILLVLWIWLKLTNKPDLIVNAREGNTGMAWLKATACMVGFLAVIYVLSLLLSFQAVAAAPVQSILSSGFQAAVGGKAPVFQGNALLLLASFALLVPIVETTVFAKLLSRFAGALRVRIDDFGSWKLWLINLVMAAGAVGFHLQAKGVKDDLALLMTGVFFFGTAVLIELEKEIEAANYFHIENNGMAVTNEIAPKFINSVFSIIGIK